MGQYKAIVGQSVYDVALHIYGSLDGLSDLFIQNPELSFANKVKLGQVFNYTDDLFTDKQVITELKANSITPSNGIGKIYPKEAPDTRVMDFICEPKSKVSEIRVNGQGDLYIDWGDNSPVQTIRLSNKYREIKHVFDSPIKGVRKIKIYGTASFSSLDLSGVSLIDIRVFRPVNVTRYIHGQTKAPIEHFKLFNEVHSINLKGSRINDLTPLVYCKDLSNLDLSSLDIKPIAVEEYLKQLVLNYGLRRGCSINISQSISGAYLEPERDSNGKYVINTGMEAVWVLVNEPEWQEAGYWKITINNKTYTTEK